MSENLSQKEMLAAKFEGGDEAREQTPIASTNKQEFTDPMLEALAEADELEHEQIKVAKDAQTSKWPKGESPGDRQKILWKNMEARLVGDPRGILAKDMKGEIQTISIGCQLGKG